MKHKHPIIAAMYDRMTESDERAFLARLRADVVARATGKVVEVGAGTGRNFAYYQPETVEEVKAVEPDPYMRRHAEPRAAGMTCPIDLIDGAAEELPFPSQFADTVVATLVICSVDSPERAASEFHRVLKPGGQLLFIEHIRSDQAWRARLQDWVTPFWHRIAGNCHPNRATLIVYRDAGFDVQEKARVTHGLFPWIPPFVAGVATVRAEQ